MDEDTTVAQYRELIPLLETLLELLEAIKRYTTATMETSVVSTGVIREVEKIREVTRYFGWNLEPECDRLE